MPRYRDIPQEILDFDDKDPLGPREITGYYYVRGFREGFQQGLDEALGERREKGLVRGTAVLLQRVIRSYHRLKLDEASRKRIEACEDLDLLNLWLSRTSNASSIDEVFNPPT